VSASGSDERGDQPTLAGLHQSSRGSELAVFVPGPNPILLDARFRITDHDEFLASAADLGDPTRILPNTGML